MHSESFLFLHTSISKKIKLSCKLFTSSIVQFLDNSFLHSGVFYFVFLGILFEYSFYYFCLSLKFLSFVLEYFFSCLLELSFDLWHLYLSKVLFSVCVYTFILAISKMFIDTVIFSVFLFFLYYKLYDI